MEPLTATLLGAALLTLNALVGGVDDESSAPSNLSVTVVPSAVPDVNSGAARLGAWNGWFSMARTTDRLPLRSRIRVPL